MDSIITEAPWFSHALACAMIVLGIVMWLFGGKALRVTFATFGAATGVLLAMTLPHDIASGGVRVLAIVGGGLIGALLGGAAFRFSVAFVLAGMFSLAVPIVSADLMARFDSPVADRDPDRPLAEAEMFLPNVEILPQNIDPAELIEQHRLSQAGAAAGTEIDVPETSSSRDRWRVWFQRCERFLQELSSELEWEWDQLPARDKSLLVMSCLGGLVLGLAIGLAAEKTSAIIVAAGTGGILFLPSIVWLMHATETPTGWLPESEGAWVLVWIGLSAIGALTQLFLLPKKNKKPNEDG